MKDLNEFDTISGTIQNVVFHNDGNDYTVLEISDNDGALITAVGSMPMSFEGEEVILKGKWTYHKEFGKQFSFDAFEKTLPKEVDGILQYLSSRTVKGIGPVTALKIVNRYGLDTFDVIENHPEWLVDIPGITMKKAAAICSSFKEQTGIRGVMMFCKDYMATAEITRIYKKLGPGAVGIIQDNPYILCNEEYGISFEKADALARSLGQELDSYNRVLNGLIYVLNYNGSVNGHTCLPLEKLILASREILGIESSRINEKINTLLNDGELSSVKIEDVTYVMTNETSENEDAIARHLYRLMRESGSYGAKDISTLIEKVEINQGIAFAPLQREALFAVLEHGVMVLTGGPGTGKTTVIKAMISIFNSIGINTVLAAPTGRAAKRMSEATGEEAKTVHRMLEMERTSDGLMHFARTERNPISEGVVIVDEASMIDVSLMSSLVKAIKRGGRLVLIGDSDQLPSVGAGNVLSDIISSERVRTIKLTDIFRQSKESLIVTNAHRINAGMNPILNVTDNDFFFVRRENERDIADSIADLITDRLPKAYGSAIRGKIQVITPSRKGVGGVDNLNSILQARINPPGKFKREHAAHGVVFREGDKVMQVVNNYDIEWEKNGAVGIGLFNGDIGVIRKIDLNSDKMEICFDDRIAEYGFDMLDELELAYAITVHKSQGSEYPVAIIPVYRCPPMLLTRNLLYTAVTRAKSMVILVGRSDIPMKMVENNREVLRYTTLAHKIQEYC